MDHPTHPICAAFRRFGNRGYDRLDPRDFCYAVYHQFRDHGHDCLGSRDFRCAVIAHGELQRVMVLPGAPNIATSCMNRGPPRICRTVSLLRNPNVQNIERLHKIGCWPSHGFAASPGVGPGATVGTLNTGYPRVQAPSQDERQDGRTCPHILWLPSPSTGLLQSRQVSHGFSSRHQGPRQLRDRHVPRGPSSRLLVQDSFRAATCPLGSSSLLLAQDSSNAAMCPVGGSCGL
jgi:hypothetical protein